MPLSPNLENYLKYPPFDKSMCHVVGSRITDKPVLFFILSSASGAQELDPERENISSRLIQQLVQEVGVKEIFTEGIDSEDSPVSSDNSEAGKLLAEGQINGVRHVQMVSSMPVTVVGIDEQNLYNNSTNILQKWESGKEEMLKALSILRTILKRLTPSTNKAVQTLLILKEAYHSGRITLSEYARGLAQQAKSVGLSLEKTPAFLKFYWLVLSEQEIDFEEVRKEIEAFSDKLMQALGEKELWLRQTLEALTGTTPNTEELQEQMQFLTNYLMNSLSMRKLRESLFFRIAMYGAYIEGFKELENPSISQTRRKKAFISGVLQGPTHILMLLAKKLMATGSYQRETVPEAYDFILDAAVFAGFDETIIPHLIRHVQYGTRYRALNTPQLTKEIETIEKSILKRTVVSGHDKVIAGLHAAYTILSKRVQLQIDRRETAKQYIREQPNDNCVRKIEHSALMQKAMCKELQVAFKILNDMETISREVYQKSERRGQAMAENLYAELSKRKIDRAIVYVGSDHCKSILTDLNQGPSYAILVPGTDRSKDPNFSDVIMDQEDIFKAESGIVFYKDIEEDFKRTPRTLCDNPLCRFSAPAIRDRIVCFSHPGSQAVFYCETCNQYYCGLELKPLEMSNEDFEELLGFNPLELVATTQEKPPLSLQCRHCGNVVGKGERTIIWNVSE